MIIFRTQDAIKSAAEQINDLWGWNFFKKNLGSHLTRDTYIVPNSKEKKISKR